MAQRTFDFNIRSAQFPLLVGLQPRTTLADSYGESKSFEDRPGVAYCHNVMPSAYGYKSVSYTEIVPALDLLEANYITDVRIIYSEQKNAVYFGWDIAGNLYAILPNQSVWTPVGVTRLSGSEAPLAFHRNLITVGTVKGQSYIYHYKVGCFVFNEDTNSIEEVELLGLVPEDLVGVVGAYGYLIAYTESFVAWSSTITVTDFVPSTISGAGGGQVGELGGNILFAAPNNFGFLFYTDSNVVAASYTSNAAYPFKFNVVANSTGGITLDYVAYETNLGSQLAFTKGGIQAITPQTASIEYPDITDFLSGRTFEDFNEQSLTLETISLPNDERMRKKVKLIAGRYVAISYGLPTTHFTHIIVVDLALKRMGKLKIVHTDVFEFISQQTEAAKETFCILEPKGSVVVVNTALTAAGSGLILLGKLQYSRGHTLQLQKVELETIKAEASFTLYDCPSLDGRNWKAATPAPSLINEGIREFHLRNTAMNHNLLLLGDFYLTHAAVTYVIGGRR